MFVLYLEMSVRTSGERIVTKCLFRGNANENVTAETFARNFIKNYALEVHNGLRKFCKLKPTSKLDSRVYILIN